MNLIVALLTMLTGCQRTNSDAIAPPTEAVANTESTMDNAITILGERDTGHGVEQKFAFIKGRTEEGVAHLIRVLDNAEIALISDDDEGGEGSATFRKTDNGYEYKDGGHGWQSDWKVMSHDQIRDRMLELVPSNMGGHWSTEGSITRRNAR